MTLPELLAAARIARGHARCGYSGFAVGAALLAEDGRVFTGCNIENATYGLTVCAERVALWKALSEGAERFTHIVVVADTDQPTPPCGTCRQLLWEFGGNFEIILGDLRKQTAVFRMQDLLPHPFDNRFLNDQG